jgi:hypothetical protein
MWLKIKIGDISFDLSIGVKIQKKVDVSEDKISETDSLSKNDISSVLNKNLLHLNFIDKLEMNYSKDQLKSLPYLQELKNIKLEAQRNTLDLFSKEVA